MLHWDRPLNTTEKKYIYMSKYNSFDSIIYTNVNTLTPGLTEKNSKPPPRLQGTTLHPGMSLIHVPV